MNVNGLIAFFPIYKVQTPSSCRGRTAVGHVSTLVWRVDQGVQGVTRLFEALAFVQITCLLE